MVSLRFLFCVITTLCSAALLRSSTQSLAANRAAVMAQASKLSLSAADKHESPPKRVDDDDGDDADDAAEADTADRSSPYKEMLQDARKCSESTKDATVSATSGDTQLKAYYDTLVDVLKSQYRIASSIRGRQYAIKSGRKHFNEESHALLAILGVLHESTGDDVVLRERIKKQAENRAASLVSRIPTYSDFQLFVDAIANQLIAKQKSRIKDATIPVSDSDLLARSAKIVARAFDWPVDLCEEGYGVPVAEVDMSSFAKLARADAMKLIDVFVLVPWSTEQEPTYNILETLLLSGTTKNFSAERANELRGEWAKLVESNPSSAKTSPEDPDAEKKKKQMMISIGAGVGLCALVGLFTLRKKVIANRLEKMKEKYRKDKAEARGEEGAEGTAETWDDNWDQDYEQYAAKAEEETGWIVNPWSAWDEGGWDEQGEGWNEGAAGGGENWSGY